MSATTSMLTTSNLGRTPVRMQVTLLTGFLTLPIQADEYIGYDGTGHFTQNGRTHNVSVLYIGVGDGTAIYDLTGGTFAADNEYIAMYSTATFAQARAPIP